MWSSIGCYQAIATLQVHLSSQLTGHTACLVLLALYISVQLRFSASPLSAHIYLSTKSTSPLSVHMPSPYPSTSPSASRPPRDTIPTFLIALTSCPPLGMELLFTVLLRVTVLLCYYCVTACNCVTVLILCYCVTLRVTVLLCY